MVNAKSILITFKQQSLINIRAVAEMANVLPNQLPLKLSFQVSGPWHKESTNTAKDDKILIKAAGGHHCFFINQGTNPKCLLKISIFHLTGILPTQPITIVYIQSLLHTVCSKVRTLLGLSDDHCILMHTDVFKG